MVHVGRPACGMNAAARGFVGVCVSKGVEPVIIYDSWKGLCKNKVPLHFSFLFSNANIFLDIAYPLLVFLGIFMFIMPSGPGYAGVVNHVLSPCPTVAELAASLGVCVC